VWPYRAVPSCLGCSRMLSCAAGEHGASRRTSSPRPLLRRQAFLRAHWLPTSLDRLEGAPFNLVTCDTQGIRPGTDQLQVMAVCIGRPGGRVKANVDMLRKPAGYEPVEDQCPRASSALRAEIQVLGPEGGAEPVELALASK
jgi:hypothetical protein